MKLNYLLLLLVLGASCSQSGEIKDEVPPLHPLAQEVKDETLRSWKAYKQNAWGHDGLKPLSKSFTDWYEEPLYISPIDAYSTLHLMGFTEEAKEIEDYVVDSLDFNKDLDAKVFEVNIRIMGGLLAMYELSGNQRILEKARDFGDRLLPAFNTGTGIPTYWVNLKTGEPSGDTVNVAEAGTNILELGILSYYTKDPKYYQAGKKATKAIFDRRSDIGLVGMDIDVQTGEWTNPISHIGAGVDSYYEYLLKAWILFEDPELLDMWIESEKAINTYIAEEHNGKLWYGRANMETGEKESSIITLYDAFLPGTLALGGDVDRAIRLQESWEWLWDQNGLEPMVYDYKKDTSRYPVYDLNPEIIESAYYLYHHTGDSSYFNMNKKFWSDIKQYCRTDVAFTSIQNIATKEQKDYMPTFFFAETLKYFYLTFSYDQKTFDFDNHIFNTEAHQFKRSSFDQTEVKKRLGF